MPKKNSANQDKRQRPQTGRDAREFEVLEAKSRAWNALADLLEIGAAFATIQLTREQQKFDDEQGDLPEPDTDPEPYTTQ